jgi:hypothetical protein
MNPIHRGTIANAASSDASVAPPADGFANRPFRADAKT